MRRKVAEAEHEHAAIEEESDDDDMSFNQSLMSPVHKSETERALQLAEQGAVTFNDFGGAHYALQQPIPVECVYVTPKDIQHISDHFIVFVWNRNFSQIIEFLRLRLQSSTHSILLVADQPLSSTQWFLVGRFVGIKVLLGNCSDTQLLVHAGAERALGIAVFPQQVHSSASSKSPNTTDAVVDSASILIFNMSKMLRNNVPCFIEVAEIRSFGFLTRDNSLLNLLYAARSLMIAPAAAACSHVLTRPHSHPSSVAKKKQECVSAALARTVLRAAYDV